MYKRQIKGPEGKQVSLKANKIGSECFRLWKACDAQVGDEFHNNPEEIESKYFGVLTKMFNIARLASQFEVPKSLDLRPDNLAFEDFWILSEFDEMMQSVKLSWERFDIYGATQSIKSFSTGIFPGHWLEMSKSRLYDGNISATWTFHRIVRDILTAFSPVCPFFTDYLSTTLYEQSAVDIREFPSSVVKEIVDVTRYLSITDDLIDFNSRIWKLKKDQGLSLKSEISDIEIPASLVDLQSSLNVMHLSLIHI